MAINYFDFWMTILVNTDSTFKAVFLAIDRYSKCNISGNNVNVDGIDASSFCSERAIFEYVIKREYVLLTSDSFWHVWSHI